MDHPRMARLKEAIKEEISDLIQKDLKDPRIGFITITAVEVSPDLRHATIFFSLLGTPSEKEETLAGLESAKGYLRTELGKRIRLKFLPDLSFKLDQSFEKSQRITELIQKIHQDEEKSERT